MDERTIRTDSVSWGCFTTPGPRPHGGPLHGSAYPQPRRPGRGVPRLLPPPGLPDLPGPDRRLDRLPRPAHHQRGLAGHRPGRQAAPRHRLRRLPLRRWEWDDLGIVLATLILTHLIPGGVVWVVVDDTLCHKRGAKVAFGGIFLDAVLSSKKHKTFRFGLNWVVLGLAVPMPMRPDRYYCLPVLWRLYRKKGQAGLPDPPPGGRGAGAEAGRGQPRADLLAGRRQRLRQRGGVAGPAGEPPGDRAAALEGGAVRAARPATAQAEGGVAQEGGPPPEPQGDDRGHRDLPRRARDDRLPEAGAGAAGAGDPRRALVHAGARPSR